MSKKLRKNTGKKQKGGVNDVNDIDQNLLNEFDIYLSKKLDTNTPYKILYTNELKEEKENDNEDKKILRGYLFNNINIIRHFFEGYPDNILIFTNLPDSIINPIIIIASDIRDALIRYHIYLKNIKLEYNLLRYIIDNNNINKILKDSNINNLYNNYLTIIGFEKTVNYCQIDHCIRNTPTYCKYHIEYDKKKHKYLSDNKVAEDPLGIISEYSGYSKKKSKKSKKSNK